VDKPAQIARMALVYGRTGSTLIWLGDEPECGVCDTASRFNMFDAPPALSASVAAQMYWTRSHLSWGSLILTTLSALLETRYTAVFDERKKVYGMLRIAGFSNTPGRPISKAEVYRLAAAENHPVRRASQLREYRDFQHVLLLRSRGPDESDLPSWIPDWSLPKQQISLE